MRGQELGLRLERRGFAVGLDLMERVELHFGLERACNLVPDLWPGSSQMKQLSKPRETIERAI